MVILFKQPGKARKPVMKIIAALSAAAAVFIVWHIVRLAWMTIELGVWVR
jgi:hypothetical protein